MPRDASGNVTLPAGNPVVSDTDITTSWGNTTMADLATMAQDSLSRTGKGGMLVPFKNLDGTTTSPGITFTNQTGTGWSRSAAGVALSIAGTRIASWITAGLSLVAGYLKSEVADGASAVAFTFNSAAMTTAGTKLLSLQNNGVEKFSIDKDGNISGPGATLNAVLSTACASDNITNLAYEDVANLTLSITTLGRPVMVMLTNSVAGSPGNCYGDNTDVANLGGVEYRVLRDAVEVGARMMSIPVQVAALPGFTESTVGAMLAYDPVAAGTYTYKLQAKALTATSAFRISNVKLLAYEM